MKKTREEIEGNIRSMAVALTEAIKLARDVNIYMTEEIMDYLKEKLEYRK